MSSIILCKRWLRKNWLKPLLVIVMIYITLLSFAYFYSSSSYKEPIKHINENYYLNSADNVLSETEKIVPVLSKNVDNREFYAHKIVHFDLKGAAPTVDYFISILDIIAKNGATGILIEYEDMFPFEGPLKDAVNSEAYTREQLITILSYAKKLNLTIIPLIQSFGHLEWILKLPKYSSYRDHQSNMAVVCITNQEAVSNVVEPAYIEILEFHKQFGVEMIHIGGDEAFNYGKCFPNYDERTKYAANYILNLSNFVRQLTNPNTRVLAWNDMIDAFWYNSPELQNTVELVVWDYGDLARFQSDYWLVKTNSKNLPIWGASAYKGADGADQLLVNITQRMSNNLIWASTKKSIIPKNKFGGLILTGWQRYDHFSTFCEILPLAIPSLIINLKIASDMDKDAALKSAMKFMNCSVTQYYDEINAFTTCKFPGDSVYTELIEIKEIYDLEKQRLLESHPMKGWFRFYNQYYNYSHNVYLREIIPSLEMQLNNIQKFKQRIENVLSKYLIGSAAAEFSFNLFVEDYYNIKKMIKNAKNIYDIIHFPKRPFNFNFE